MSYQENRKYIISKFPFLRNLERYDKIIPKVLSTLVWPLYKPKKVNYNGKVFFLSKHEYPNPSRDLFAYKNTYNNYEKKILETYLKKNSNCIDVGANIGFFTYLFLKKIGQRGQIYSFENNPGVFSILKKNFIGNSNIIFKLGKVGINKSEIVIDKIINCNVDFIKIDIDGADYYALKSCENIIKKNNPKIIIELSEASEREHGIHYNKTVEFLSNNNYNLYEIKNKLEKFNRKLRPGEVINLFALHSSNKL